ncbi:MAG: FtsX-like permease family protein [Candidatus Palauibacterales bacterium]|nr:FtsX-like permease family protein [Candidatus Palauibacterales bacterium]
MRSLDRKLARDLLRLWAQVLSIALVVAAGVATIVLFRSAFDSLEASTERFYRQARFADVWGPLKRAPEFLARRIERIEGVAAVETRIVLDVTLDVPGVVEPAVGRLVSLPDRGEPRIDRLHLLEGRLPETGRREEAVVNEQFALANRLVLGDSVGAVINGRWERIRIVGMAMSPEYVYPLGPGGAYATDNTLFGVFWMRRRALAAAYDAEGAFNEVSLRLAPGSSEDAVISDLDRILAPYGGIGAYGREDQPSNRVIEDEVEQNRATGTVVPAMILGVAAFLLSVVLGRMVVAEREQIGVLKAFGYRNRDLGWHYLRFALAAVLLGSLIGIGAGVWLGGGLVRLYGEYFRLPDLKYRASWGLVLGAVAISGLAAAVGALGAVRRVVRLPPAEAMRPEPPARFARGWIERVLPARTLSTSGRIVLRNLTRRPFRTGVSVLGVGLAAALIFGTLFFYDAFRYTFDLQFAVAQRQSLTVLLNAPRSDAVRHDLRHLAGVRRVEPFRAVPVRLRSGHRMRQLALLGLEPTPKLSRVVDRDGRAIATPETGVLVSAILARMLGVRPGDSVRVEVLEGRRPVVRLPVAGTVDDLFGINAYMDRRALSRLLGEGPTVSGAHLAVDAPILEPLQSRLKRIPRVAGVSSPAAMLRHFEESMAESLDTTLLIVSIFAAIIAVGVIYNGARIALSERGRELASLRVLGFTRHEIAVILLGEQGVITALAIPAGFGLGLVYCLAWILSLNGESYRIPIVFAAASIVWTGLIILGIAALTGAAVWRRLKHLDLIGVLKTRE